MQVSPERMSGRPHHGSTENMKMHAGTRRLSSPPSLVPPGA